MSDFTLTPSSTLIVGMTGSGKTIFSIRYLLNAPDVACRFIYDDLYRIAPRLKLRPCYTAREVEASLETRWSVCDPRRMFADARDPLRTSFAWWSDWVYHASRRGPGKKLVLVDELWRFCTEDSIPRGLQLIANAGREENIELVCCTQQPELINASITGQCTELVCFRLQSPESLRAIAKLGADAEHVARLPLGTFLSYDRLTGASLAGRLF